MAKRPQGLSKIMSTRSGQGVIAFLLGGFTLGALAALIFTFSTISIFIASHLYYGPSSFSVWNENIRWLNNCLLLFGVLVQMVPAAAIGASVVILGMRWLINIRPSWMVIRTFVFVAIGLSCVVYAVNFSFAFVGNLDDRPSLFLQALSAYAQILSLGLPFSLAWLWSTRNNPSKKGARA